MDPFQLLGGIFRWS